MDLRYLGILIMALSVLMALTVYGLSSYLMSSISMGSECSDVGTCPHVAALNQSYIGYLSSGVMFIAGLFIFLKGRSVKPRRAMPKDLQPDEERIYKIVEESGGIIFQSEIVEKTGFPKARVTRVLDRLEAKDVLERRRRGMTNAVMLK
jgi:uncharacterized membrane protein